MNDSNQVHDAEGDSTLSKEQQQLLQQIVEQVPANCQRTIDKRGGF